MKKISKTTKQNGKKQAKHMNIFVKRQHQIGKIFRDLMKRGFDPQTSIKVALEETSDNSI